MAQMRQNPSAISLAPQQQPREKLGEFQRTKPPTFSYVVEPMDADDWLKVIEKKLSVARCNNREKVRFASHQQMRPATNWWDAYVSATDWWDARVQECLPVSSCSPRSNQDQEEGIPSTQARRNVREWVRH